MLSIGTPEELTQQFASRIRTLRLQKAWSREELAVRSGVKAATIKFFETTGQISLARLLALSFALGVSSDFDNVLLAPDPISMQDLKRLTKPRQRGRRT
jgi:transcriptional regulator with XRE-family HTH domain